MSAQTPGGRLSDAEVAQWAAPDTSRGAYVGKLAREVQEHRTMVERLKALHVVNTRSSRCVICGHGWPCPTRAIIDAIAEPTDAAPQQKETP